MPALICCFLNKSGSDPAIELVMAGWNKLEGARRFGLMVLKLTPQQKYARTHREQMGRSYEL
jgi:hypothetical protein